MSGLFLKFQIMLKSPSKAKLVKNLGGRTFMLFSYNTERFDPTYPKFVGIFSKTLDVLPAKQLMFYR